MHALFYFNCLKIIHLSLRCLLYLFKYSNACIRKQITDVNERLFVILNDYSGHGSVNSNPMIVELQQLLFKVYFLHYCSSNTLILAL